MVWLMVSQKSFKLSSFFLFFSFLFLWINKFQLLCFDSLIFCSTYLVCYWMPLLYFLVVFIFCSFVIFLVLSYIFYLFVEFSLCWCIVLTLVSIFMTTILISLSGKSLISVLLLSVSRVFSCFLFRTYHILPRFSTLSIFVSMH